MNFFCVDLCILDWIVKNVTFIINSRCCPSLIKKVNIVSVPGSPVHTGYSSPLNGSYRVNSSFGASPYKNLTTSPPSAKYTGAGAAPLRGQSNFDPRTFTRAAGARAAGAYSLAPDDETRPRKTSYHRLNFGSTTEEESGANSTFDKEPGNNTFTASGDHFNGTFDKVDEGGSQNKASDVMTDNRGLNSTFDTKDSVKKMNSTFERDSDQLNSTFTGPPGGGNSTFTSPPGGGNSTFTQISDDPGSGLLNRITTFEKELVVMNGGSVVNTHRKMSEDRLSSASSRYVFTVLLRLF